jgi:hypothetical protein
MASDNLIESAKCSAQFAAARPTCAHSETKI